jgi:hypothetical protein
LVETPCRFRLYNVSLTKSKLSLSTNAFDERQGPMKRFSQSRSAVRGRYPLATIAAYGPDTTLATKLVVSVIERPGQDDPTAMRSWTTAEVDVRHDPTIAADVDDFIRHHHAKRTASADRILGCPHEEGIDYPMGRTCPRCPFWAAIDRFTHEPVTPPVPTLQPAEILADLSSDEHDPREALESADGHRSVLVEPLLRAIDDALAKPSSASPEEATLFSYALYLLAKWREPRAYPSVVRWLSLPGEAPFHIGGDIVTQDGGRILAAVCNGDLEPIKALVASQLHRHPVSVAGTGGTRASARSGVEQLGGRERRHRSAAAIPGSSPCVRRRPHRSAVHGSVGTG